MSGTSGLFDRIKRRQGQTAVEYAMILAGVALIVAASFNSMGNNILSGAVNETVALLSGSSNAGSGGGAGSGSGGGGDGGDGHGHGDGGDGHGGGDH